MNNLIAVIILALFIPSIASASVLFDCKVKQIHYPYFSESLSADEYPDVSVEEQSGDLAISVGINEPFSQASGDWVEAAHTVGFDKAYKFRYKDSPDTLTLIIESHMRGHKVVRTGALWVKEADKFGSRKIADLSCK